VSRNKRRYGGYLVHIGIVLMFVGFAGGSYKKETEVTLERGQQTTLGKYTIRFDDFHAYDTVEKKIAAARVTVMVGGKEIAHPEPAKWYFPHHEEEPVTDVQIGRGVLEDLYLVLNGQDLETGIINLKIVINPLVNWIWVGFLMLALGTGVALSPERAYQLAESAAREGGGAAKAGVTGLFLLLFLGGAGVARADNPAGNPMGHEQVMRVVEKPRTPVENELFHKIVCTCGGCKRELLADCTCGFAKKKRDEISTMLASGKTKEDIINWVGPETLAVHPNSWMLVILAYAAILGGAGALVFAARSLTARKAAATAAGQAKGSAPVASNDAHGKPGQDDQQYQDRLDDELDDLD
jgi:cytochrome c-type biogenesis protein CcmF